MALRPARPLNPIAGEDRPPRHRRPRPQGQGTALVPVGHPQSAELMEPTMDVSGRLSARRAAKGKGRQVVRWSPPAQMGNLQISAPEGMRAAVVPLRPGLYLVAEVENQGGTSLQGEDFGFALTAAITAAAKGALKIKQAADAKGVTSRELLTQKGKAAIEKGKQLKGRWQDRREGGESLRSRWQSRQESRVLNGPRPIPAWSTVSGESFAGWGAWA